MLDVVPPSARSDDLKWYRANLFKVGSMTIEWINSHAFVCGFWFTVIVFLLPFLSYLDTGLDNLISMHQLES